MLETESTALLIPARRIPAPSTISAEAKAALARGSPLAAVVFAEAEPSSDDKDAWRRLIAKREQLGGPLLAQAAKLHLCEVATHALGRSQLHELTPRSVLASAADRAVLYFHPGGYVAGGGLNAAYLAMPLADKLGLNTFSVDYRMPPDHPFPAAVDDAVEAYEFVLKGRAPDRVVVAGRSAGGGLAAAFLLKVRDLGMPMPAACVLQTPEADLTESGDSFEINNGIDNFLRRLTNSVALYANGHDLRDPYLSPVYGDYKPGFPPTILTSGTRDLYLSNTVLMHRALRRAGIEAELHIWEAMGHGGFFGMAPEDEEVWEELRCFTSRHLGLPYKRP